MRYLQQQLLFKPIHVRSKLDSEQLPAVQVVSWTLACSTCLSLHAFFADDAALVACRVSSRGCKSCILLRRCALAHCLAFILLCLGSVCP